MVSEKKCPKREREREDGVSDRKEQRNEEEEERTRGLLAWRREVGENVREIEREREIEERDERRETNEREKRVYRSAL